MNRYRTTKAVQSFELKGEELVRLPQSSNLELAQIGSGRISLNVMNFFFSSLVTVIIIR